MAETTVQTAVREKHGEIAKSVGNTHRCEPAASCGVDGPKTSVLYSAAETQGLPSNAVAASAFIRARKPPVKACCWPACCA